MALKIIVSIVNKVLSPGDTLGKRTIRGGFWVFTLRISNRLLQFARTVVLARLLAPEDFGLFGIALLSLSLLDTFSQTGFWQALIQKKEDVKPYLNTAWTVGLIRGVTIAAILFLTAPSAASFFNEPNAVPILRVIGLAIIFQNLTNIAVLYFDKKLEFHKYFAYMFIGTIADLIVSITAAILLRSVWALIFGQLAGALFRAVFSYVLHPYRPSLALNIQKAKELFSFGKWILGSSILIFFTTQGDDLFVGKFIGVAALGFYQVAYRISNMTATEMTFPILKVTFPAYARLQDDLHRLREAYLKVVQMTAFVVFPVAGLIFVLADNFTLTFLGEKWEPAILIMKILVFQACGRAIRRTLDPLSKAIGHPEIVTKVTFIQLIILVLLIYPAASLLGISGVALVVAFQSLSTLPVIAHQVLRRINIKFMTFIKTLSVQFIATAMMVIAIYFLSLHLPYNIVTFAAEVLLGLFIYLCFIWLIKRSILKNLQYLKSSTLLKA